MIMKSIVVQNEQLKKLLSDYDSELEAGDYSEETRKAHACILRRIQIHMDNYGLSEYDPSVGDAYYQDYLAAHENHGTCDVIKAVIKKFNTFYQEGFVPPAERGVFYNESLEKLMGCLEKALRDQGYKDPAIHFYRRLLRPVQHFMRKQGIEDYSPDVGKQYIKWYQDNHDRASDQVLRFITSCINRVDDVFTGNSYIRQHAAISGIKPPELFKEPAKDFLKDCRLSGNKPATLRIKEIAISQFLSGCESEGCASLEDITPSMVILICDRLGTKKYCPYVGHFLRFLALEGRTERDLSTFVPEVRFETKSPSTYTVDEINSAESAIGRDDHRGKRDYAIFLLASRLGIRAGDILRLHKDSLDFNNDIISFTQHKTHKAVSHPMLPEIREALEAHLACSGYNPEGYVFAGTLAPYGLLTNTTISNIITKYLEMASVDTAGKHHGPHSLRASMATSMVNDSVPYDAVRKALGHSDPNAIKHYAKNDLENLRRCALDVPAASGILLDFLGREARHE